jgi:thymidylate synthase (FAD)
MTEFTLTSDITVRPVQQMGGDAMVVAAARVSTSGEEALKLASLPVDENLGLIRYLMKHRHGTPFEHAALTFFVHAPIFVFREWHRHRIGFSYNEESARYKEMEPTFWVPRRERLMVPAKGFKPARPQFVLATRDQHDAACLALPSGYKTA